MESNGPPEGAGEDLVEVRDADKNADAVDAELFREEGDGASTSSSAASDDFESFEKLQAEMMWGGDDKDEEDLLNTDSFPWHQQDEKLLEELFRLKLTSVHPGPFGNGSAASAVSGASLPPKQRIKLYQPRTKLEQFEDILLQSQLLEANLPELEVSALAEAAGLTGNDLEFDLMEGFDFEASDAIFNEAVTTPELAVPLTKDHENIEKAASSSMSNSSSLASSTCDCFSCRERHSIEAEESDELERLRKFWFEVREDVKRVYRLVLCNAWNDPNRFDERPDLNAVKEKVHKLVWRDAHQLFRRLEGAVKEFVLEIKFKLIDLLQKQAKNPSLAQDFIQYLLEGYEKVCTAAQHVSPALMDLEVEHLRRFSLTWEVLNKHLYQSIIYVDPLIENNLPIFLSQLRSLFPDKEHEARYTELVRGYLDFDVEMVNIGAFWKTSETMINEYNAQQNQLRAKQQMLKEDWERFKSQRKALEKQIQNSSNKEQEQPAGVEKCECDVCLIPGIPPLGPNSSKPSPSTSCPTGECSSASKTTTTGCLEKMPNLAKLYPHLMQTIKQGGLSSLGSPAFLKDNQGLAALFPSLLTVDGPKLPTSTSLAAELSQALSTALSLADEVPDSTASCMADTSATRTASVELSLPEASFTQQKEIDNLTATTEKINKSEHQNQPSRNVETAKKSNAEINKLLQQHYCSHKNKKRPSASAIRKGKVPLPPSCVVDDGDSTDEFSEDSSSLPPDDTCSSASSMTSQLGGHGSTNGKACSCCYCEVFGHNNGVSGGQTVAPVSRNYPEMRERLRLLLSKKKKEQARCKQQHHPQQQQRSTTAILQQPSCSASGSSSVTSSTSSVKSSTPSGNVVKKEVLQNPVPTSTTAAPPAAAANKPTPPPYRAATVAPTAKPALPVNNAAPPKSATPLAGAANAQARSQSASSLAPNVPPPPLRLEKSRSAVAPKAVEGAADKPFEKDLELLLEFIEGSAASANEKRKAKKERQKQQKLEEIRVRELEEQRKREAEEAERKRREEEERRQLELERQMMKKAKKKAAQRAKKATANGLRIEDLVDTEDDISIKVSEEVPPTKIGLEDLRARQMRELQELQARHQKQMEEEQRKLMETKQQQQTQQQQLSKKGNKKAASKKAKEGSVPPPNSNSMLNDVAKAGPGTQIKITRTASGGVEFTTIPAEGAPPKKIPKEATAANNVGPLPSNVLFNQMNLYSSPLMQQQQQQQQPFMPSQQPSPDRPSVPSKMTPSQPMVTIRRIENPGLCEPTGTISTQGGAKESSKKLLYTLINGQVHRAKDAPEDLIPGAKPLPEDFTNILFQPNVPMMSQAPHPSPFGTGSRPPPQPRPALPTDNKGRLDLDRLQLPPGISITKIQGAAPQRKYFPSKPDTDQTVLPLPGTLNHPPPQKVIDSGFGYSAMAGMPMGMNGPNVIVVETSTLKTREEERKELEGKKKNNKKKKSAKSCDQPVAAPSSSSPQHVQQQSSNLGASYPYLAPQIPEVEGSNSLKSGPQVLIKNVNGSVVITPIPSSPTNVNVVDNKTSKKVNNGGISLNGNGTFKDRESPKSKPQPEIDASRTGSQISSALLKKHAVGENIDEINSIFAPKDIDLDNGDIDEDEREIEAFKRFCLDSVPLQQKPKVNFDVKNINFKKK